MSANCAKCRKRTVHRYAKDTISRKQNSEQRSNGKALKTMEMINGNCELHDFKSGNDPKALRVPDQIVGI